MGYNENNTAIVLLSGGMDSAVCTALAAYEGYKPAVLHLNYGQRTQKRELIAFHEIADHFEINKRLIVDVSYLSQIGGSSLTDKSIEIEKAKFDKNHIPNTYVPFRNGNIIAIAVSWAEVIGARAIIIGAMEQDSSGYPDCRSTFFDAINLAIKLGTKPETEIRVLTPIIDMTKAEIIKRGSELGVPFEKTWSCYKNSDVACGVCESCALRLKGFAAAGYRDPIKYELKIT
ncbi:MAG: 7-cyano-7-deazaguanine synthase QueC [Desulfobulbaceae bacterium]|nr:7-cyano-7-deazaguanine synthase QueC [Desulfobulbaceae bacterium]MBS4001324.1 7-cyano-7-deazaguanine synthase QueC [Desulfobulbaceae bacterium]